MTIAFRWCVAPCLFAALALAAAPARAQDEAGPSPRHAAALAAGFRALHYCTGLFSSGMSRETLDFTSRSRTRTDAALRMEVDEKARTVAVHFSPDMEPRIAVWRPHLGCTQLPIGARMSAAALLPRIPATVTAPALDAHPWPMGDENATTTLAPERRAAVEKVLDDAFLDQAGPYRGDTWGVVVIKGGKIVAERYAPGFGVHVMARTNSMCKSLSVSLVGIGVRRGLLDVHRKAPLAEWRRPGDPRGEITLDHLLRMSSGLYTENGGDPQQELYSGGAAAAEISALNRVDSRPGARYVYAGSDTILATRALRQAVNDDRAFLSFPQRELLWKLGMTRTLIETDWNDDFLISGQCWSTARDFGRFGLFYLADGVWNGERLLPEGWSRYVSTRGPAQPAATPGRSGYGAQFWSFDRADGLPDLAYSPAGALGQYAMIVPSQNMVIVRRGFDSSGPGFRIAKFSADLIGALGK
jgi:CubicO group peptidase (beta-lactamase class C family)